MGPLEPANPVCLGKNRLAPPSVRVAEKAYAIRS